MVTRPPPAGSTTSEAETEPGTSRAVTVTEVEVRPPAHNHSTRSTGIAGAELAGWVGPKYRSWIVAALTHVVPIRRVVTTASTMILRGLRVCCQLSQVSTAGTISTAVSTTAIPGWYSSAAKMPAPAAASAITAAPAPSHRQARRTPTDMMRVSTSWTVRWSPDPSE